MAETVLCCGGTGAAGGSTARLIKVDWAESAEDLYQRFTVEQDLPRRKRVQALWLGRSGRSVAEASQVAGVGERSLQRWVSWYRQGGLAAVLARVPGQGARGNPSRLTAAQQEALLAEVGTGRFRTHAAAQQWVDATFGVRYSYHGLWSLLDRLGVHPKVPRPKAAKADPDVQAAWKKGGSATPSAPPTCGRE
ncbi:MAG TPA: winged helix-turn-helix domain-containing protein [Thermomicrobiaceae bacterium]|nr:winged helix-turn-helix domain-containing protein [Thermomicrobiaceae bacterium]